jgi:HK97 family phage portal protein
MNYFKKQLLNIAVKSGVISLDNSSSQSFFSSEWVGGRFGFSKYVNDNQLIDDGYAINNAVYSVVKLSTDASTSIPFVLCERTKEGDEEVTSGGLYDLLQNPNDTQIFKEFQEEAITYLKVTGDLFLHGVRLAGFKDAIQDLSVLPSNCTELNLDYKNDLKSYEVNLNGTITVYPIEDVYHGKYINPTKEGLENKRGLSPFQAGHRTVIASNENLNAMASVWNNKGVSGLLTSNTDETLSNQEAQGVQEAVNNRLGGAHKANGVAATTANVRFEQIGMPSSDMELLMSSPQLLRGICMLLGVDPALLGDTESRKYSNLKEAEKSLFVRSAIPDNERLISYLMRFVVPAWNLIDNKEYIIKQNLEDVEALQPDKKIQAEKNKIVSETITNVLASPISDESKIATLIYAIGITEEEAKELTNFKEEVMGTGTAENTGGNVQVQSLNGAQVTSMVTIVAEVGLGNMPKESAINILIVSYGMSEEEAKKIIDPIIVKENGEAQQGFN